MRRDKYADVGAAIRQAGLRAAEQQVTAREYRVLAAIFTLVSSYSRLIDQVPVKRSTQPSIAEVANLPDNKVGSAVKKLADRRIIVYWPARGRGKCSLVGLPAVGELGEYFPAPQKAPSTGDFSGEEKAPTVGLKGPHHGSEKAPTRGAHPRSIPRRSPENQNPALEEEEHQALLDALTRDLAKPTNPKRCWLLNEGRFLAESERDFRIEIATKWGTRDPELVEVCRRFALGEPLKDAA